MSHRTAHPRRLLIASVGALSLTAAGLATTGATAPTAARSESSLSSFLADHPGLRRAQPVSTMAEKIGDGGEGSSGPAQEQYDAHAYPAAGVAPAQVAGARTAFARKGKGSSGFSQVGPDKGTVPASVTYTGKASTVGGRTTVLLPVGPCTNQRCLVLAGTAGGGVWRTTTGLAATPTWSPVGSGITSNAIGSLALAGGLVYAGTGEPNGSSDSEAGTGLFVSKDDGSSFTRVPTALPDGTDLAVGRSVGSVTVDRANASHLLVGTAVARHGSSSVNGGRFTPPGSAKVGIYESLDGGGSWTLSHAEDSDTVTPGTANGGDFFRGGVTRIEQDPTDAATVYAAISDYGLFRRVGSGDWTRIYASAADGDPASSATARTEFDAVALTDGKTRIYVGDTFASGSPTYVAGLLRTDDARAAAPDFALLSSANPADPGRFSSYNYCSRQCSYDMPVASPDGQPDVVLIGGQMQYAEIFTAHQPSNGRAVQRSTDAGRSFTDMTNDVTTNGLHPDQHAIAFAGGATFLASDGGINRLTGGFADRSADCDSRGLTAVQLVDCKAWLSSVPVSNSPINSGLQNLQFQSVSVSPKGNTLLAGAQDNGTWTLNDQGGRTFESVGGDGGQSGFDAGDASIRYHSYYAPQHDVNFRGSDPTGWNWISDRLLGSGEAASFYTPLTADPKVPGTVFDGLQHVWRSTDNGGDPAYLTKHCNEFTGDFDPAFPCGDFVPLGGPKLTGTEFGTDKRTGDYVVAIARPVQDASTMWVGNRRGRLFISHNVNADAGAVTFTRIDTKNTPTRFVSGIAVDPTDVNHAIVSYSGYNAYNPTAPGHVFDVRVNAAGTATFTDLSGNLGDMPITSVARDAASGTVYLGTDFGVLSAKNPTAGATWMAIPGLPVVAVYGLTVDPTGKALYAATHGRGIWGAKP